MEFFEAILQSPDAYKYLLMPFICALIGWGTNWLAIKLTFAPEEFIGIKPFLGWQGIVPSKISKMSTIIVDSVQSKLGSLTEIYQAMDPDALATQVTRVLRPRIDEFVDEIMSQRNALLWENLPMFLKNRVYTRAHRQIPKVVDSLIKDLGDHIEELVDLKYMVNKILTEDKSLLNRIFQECGAKEMQFLIKSGAVLGFMFGIAQMYFWATLEATLGPWILPVFGFLVGYLTNLVALRLIFQPLKPKRIGPFTLHGLFLQRQKEVSEVYSQIVTSEVLTINQLVKSMMHGPRSDKSRSIIRRHVYPEIDAFLIKVLAQLSSGSRGYSNLKKSVTEKAYEVSTDPFSDKDFNLQRASGVEELFRQRMMSLSSEEFQELLRPAFKEDEGKLIIIGGILGTIGGVIQLSLVWGVKLAELI